jgi:hypothetical protein
MTSMTYFGTSSYSSYSPLRSRGREYDAETHATSLSEYDVLEKSFHPAIHARKNKRAAQCFRHTVQP